MDFQFAPNLSAIGRRQTDVSDALRHIGACLDCLNREVIMPECCPKATEQLLDAARASSLQVLVLLSAQSDEGADRLQTAQIAFIMERPAQLTSASEPGVRMNLVHIYQ